MKDYSNDNPQFSSSIQIVEVTDPAHADNVNAAPKQLLDNDLVIAAVLNPERVSEAFKNVFTYIDDDPQPEDEESMTTEEVEDAIENEWHGESSTDPTAMSSEQVQDALNTTWDGSSSTDPTALNKEEVAEALENGGKQIRH